MNCLSCDDDTESALRKVACKSVQIYYHRLLLIPTHSRVSYIKNLHHVIMLKMSVIVGS